MARNRADKYTDKTFSQLESQISRMYKEAQKDISRKLLDFTKRHRAKDKQMLKDLNTGKITYEQYQSWLTGQIFIGNQWRHKKEQITESIKHVMQEASNISRGKAIDVFAENANHTAFEIEKDLGSQINFGLYDAHTVSRLIRDEPELLPRKVVNGKKLEAWNQKVIANSISQGIVQGESIDEISKRIARDTCISAGRSSTLYARTAVTGAQNAGRMERLHEAKDMGVNVKKRWMATLDNRTRDTHAELDGETIDVDEKFSNGLMYPGDPSGDPSEVYNCRCTMVYIYPEYEQHFERTAYYEEGDPQYDHRHRNYETVQDMTYEQWVEYKQNQIRARYGGEPKPVSEPEEPTFRQPTKDEYDGGEEVLEQERQKIREIEKQRREINDQIKADRDRIDEIRRERRRLDDLSIAQGPMAKDYSGFDIYQTKTDYDKHRDELVDELSKMYDKLDNMERPKGEDYTNEDDFYRASNKYFDERGKLRSEIEAKEKELYAMPEYSKVETWRKARSLGEEGINARRQELDREMSEISSRRDALLKKDEDLYKEQSGYFHAELVDRAERRGVEYSIPTKLETPNSIDTIVERVGGGDMTTGSCASLGFCYVGQTEGYDILDFRGGQSQDLFSRVCDDVLRGISGETGKPLLTEATSTGTGGAVKLIKQTAPGHEYYFTCGRHAAIVRSNEDGKLEYLELQSRYQNGWKLLGYKNDRRSMDYTFTHRFGCSRGVDGQAYMMDVEDMRGSKILHRAMGYINTASDQQKKGATGHER